MKIKKGRGYFGIGVYHPKTEANIGTLWRSAYNFGADFIFTIGKRYKKQASDTIKATRHIPLFEYQSIQDFKNHIPLNCQPIFIEQTPKAKNIKDFIHSERAIYILGAEDNGIPEKLIAGHQQVFIDTPMCLNVAVAGSIVMFDRNIKLN